MTTPGPPSLRTRLTRRLLIGVGGLLVAACLGTYLVVSTALQAQFDDTLIAKSEALVTASEIDEEGFEIDLVIQDFADFGVMGNDMFEMWHPDGTVFARSPSLHANTLGELPEFDWDGVDVRSYRLDDGQRVRLCARRFIPKDDDGTFAESRLVVAMPLAPLDRTLRVLAAVLVGVGGCCLLMLGPLVGRSLRAGLSPLTAINAQLRQWDGSPGSWTIEDAQVPVELVPMVGALTASLERVAASFARERRFSANAAHELRTPLAEIRAMAELAERWPDEATPTHAAEIVEVADRMARLLQQLSELARAEGAAVAPELVDQRAVISTILEQRSTDIETRALRVNAELEPATLLVDPDMWRSVIENLIGNAIAHAPVGSTLNISATSAEFRIGNPAPGLDSTAIERLFERFWRPPGAGHDDHHSGLGLAIVDTIVARLGATICATLDDDGVLWFRVTWRPTAAATDGGEETRSGV